MFQQTIIVGSVGKDPEMRYTPSGQAVTNFSVAANSQYTSKGGELVKKTIWFRVSTWGKQAEVMKKYVTKGMKVMVVGALIADNDGNPKTFTKGDGTAGANFEINAQTVRFLSKSEASAYEHGSELPVEDDLPF